VSIALFLLLSGFFLAALLGSTERSRKLIALAAGCLAAIVCIIIFLKPVQLPSTYQLLHGTTTTTAVPVPPGRPGAAGSDGVIPTSSTVPGETTPSTTGPAAATSPCAATPSGLGTPTTTNSALEGSS
jgi:hypothetical protein